MSCIVYADCSFEAMLRGKLFHDIVGHYNRFDVLQLQIDRTQRGPLKDVTEAGAGQARPT